jgi:hypothetical protein
MTIDWMQVLVITLIILMLAVFVSILTGRR